MPLDTLDLAEEALGVLAVDPHGLGGGLLRVRPGPHLDAWLVAFREARPGIPIRKIPAHAETARLAGEIDVVSTLATGRRTARPGLLAETDGGLVVVPMAERTAPEIAALLAEALDTGWVAPREHGLEAAPARLGVLLFDESRPDEAGAPVLLADRLAVHVAVDPQPGGRTVAGPGPDRVRAARRRLAEVEASAEQVEALVAAADGLGIPTARALIGAVRAARARAALHGRAAPNDDDLAVAVALVLLPRARRLPADAAPDDQAETPPPPPPPPESPEDGGDEEPANEPTGPLADRVVEAALAALPDGTLESIREGASGVAGGVAL